MQQIISTTNAKSQHALNNEQ